MREAATRSRWPRYRSDLGLGRNVKTGSNENHFRAQSWTPFLGPDLGTFFDLAWKLDPSLSSGTLSKFYTIHTWDPDSGTEIGSPLGTESGSRFELGKWFQM